MEKTRFVRGEGEVDKGGEDKVCERGGGGRGRQGWRGQGL